MHLAHHTYLSMTVISILIRSQCPGSTYVWQSYPCHEITFVSHMYCAFGACSFCSRVFIRVGVFDGTGAIDA